MKTKTNLNGKVNVLVKDSEIGQPVSRLKVLINERMSPRPIDVFFSKIAAPFKSRKKPLFADDLMVTPEVSI